MFNTYINKRTEYVPYVQTIVENRAPTDESIKILKEMEAAVIDKIIDEIKVENNTFNFTCYVVNKGIEKQVIGKFILNGTSYPIEFTLDTFLKYNKQMVVDTILENIRDYLARIICLQMFQNKDIL